MTIATNLATLKRVLGPRSERDIIVASVSSALRPGVYRWLDVGIGDAVSLSQILTSLADSGRTFEVIGIDPELTNLTQCQGAGNFSAFKCAIEDYEDAQAFDVINVRQSAHYFGAPAATLHKLQRRLSAGGVLALTHWTRDCILYQIHVMIAQELGVAPSGMSICDLQRQMGIDASLAETQTTVVGEP